MRVGHLVVPAIHADITTIHDRILQLGSIDRSAIRCQLATEFRVKIGAGVVQGSNVAVPSTTFAVSFGIMGIEIVAAGKSAVTAWNPAHMRLLL